MTSTKKSTRSNIMAEVWSRAALATRLESGANPEPVSRHRSVEAAQNAAGYRNMQALVNVSGRVTRSATDRGIRSSDAEKETASNDYVVYARVPDSPTFIELVSWKGGIKTTGDPTWVYNGQRFAGRLEAAAAVSDVRSRWVAVNETVVAPSSEPVNYRWDDDHDRAVPIDRRDDAPAPGPAPQDAPPAAPTPDLVIDSLTAVWESIRQDVLDAHQKASPALPAVEQALRDAGVVVESPEDPTEATRRVLQHVRNTEAPAEGTREYWEVKYGAGNVWSTQEVGQAYEIIQFAVPFVYARRKSDNVKGLLQFAHSPRFYFDFTPEVL